MKALLALCTLIFCTVDAAWYQDYVTLSFSQNPAYGNSHLKMSCNFSRHALLAAVTIYASNGTHKEGSLCCSIEEGTTTGTGVFSDSSYEGCPTFDPLSGHVNVTLQASSRLALNYSCSVSLVDHELFYDMMSNVTRLEIRDLTTPQESYLLMDEHSIIFALGYTAFKNVTDPTFKNVTDVSQYTNQGVGVVFWSLMAAAISVVVVGALVVVASFRHRKQYTLSFDTKRSEKDQVKMEESKIVGLRFSTDQEKVKNTLYRTTGELGSNGSSATDQKSNADQVTPRKTSSDQYEVLINQTTDEHEYAVVLG